MRGLIVLLLWGSASSCLVRDKSSGAKKLHEESGRFKTGSQVKEEQQKRREDADAAINKMCGKAVKRRVWAEDERVPYDEHHFVAETKAKSCEHQSIAIGVKAAQFLRAKSITCSLTPDGYLRFEIPNSDSHSDRIRVDCETEFIDLRSDGSSLSISTFEKNGKGYLAMVDSFGRWNNRIEQISKGIDEEEMIKIEDAAVVAMNESKDNLKDKIMDHVLGITGLGVSAGVLTVASVSANATLVGLGVGAAAATATIAAPVAVVSLGVGMAIRYAIEKRRQRRASKAELTATSFLLRKSVGAMLADFKS